MICDFHMHGEYSVDGLGTTQQFVNWVEKPHVRAAALTDHNTTLHLNALADLVSKKEVARKVVPGCELTCHLSYPYNIELHILCYWKLQNDKPWHSETVQSLMHQLRAISEENLSYTCEQYAKHGIDLRSFWGHWQSHNQEKNTVPNPHITYLMEQSLPLSQKRDFQAKRIQLDSTIADAQDRPRFPDAEEVVRIMVASGAITMLAHPLRYGFVNDQLAQVIGPLVNAGLHGVERYYPGQDIGLIPNIPQLSSLGSDLHDLNMLDTPAHLQFLNQANASEFQSESLLKILGFEL